MEIALEPFGFLEFGAYMDDLGFRSENAARALSAIGDDIFHRNAGAFEGAPDLTDTGALRASLTERRARGAVWDVRDTEAMFGTEIPYARFHQTRLLEPLMDGRGPERWMEILDGWFEDGEAGIRMVGL